MIKTHHDPCHAPLELRLGLEGVGQVDPLVSAEPALAEHHVRHLLAEPDARVLLHEMLVHDLPGDVCRIDDDELCRLLVARLSSGALVLVRTPWPDASLDRAESGAAAGRWAALAHALEPAPAPREAEDDHRDDVECDPEPAPAQTEEVTRDHKIECKHHAAGSRAFIDRGSRIQVVPDKGETSDRITIHWRDDSMGAMPASIPLTTAGRPATEAKRSGAGGGYTAYKGEVEFLGDLEAKSFPFPPFWEALNRTTLYTFGPGPQAIDVEVFNPRQFKLEMKFPPLDTLKAGYKYSVETHSIDGDVRQGLSLVKKQTVKEHYEVKEEGWRPSKLKIDKSSLERTRTTTDGSTSLESERTSKHGAALADSIVLSRDGGTLEIDAVKMVGGIIEFVRTVLDLVKKVGDYAPQVGWYVDLDVQVMQGGLAVEWYWKEWEDERVFRYLDVNASLDIFSVTFELGIGVSGFTFKVQVFGQVSGSFGFELSGTRYKPTGAPGFKFGGKRTWTGALGARVEAGYIFKFDAKMETGLEVDITIGVNQPNRSHLLHLDGGLVWTGIQCSANGSVGAFGIAGTKKWKGTLMEKSERLHFEWPTERTYEPPFMSRDAIKKVMVDVLSKGWDVRVFTPSGFDLVPDHQWTLDEVAGQLADRIERDDAFHRTPAMVDALANAIRRDLDALGARRGRDWIESDRFQRYLAGGVDGRSIARHLKDGASPLRKLTG